VLTALRTVTLVQGRRDRAERIDAGQNIRVNGGTA